MTTTRAELLRDGSDFMFRRLVHGLFGFAARHEAIRSGHGAVIGLAGIEYTVLISIAHLRRDGEVAVKDIADHLHVTGAFVTRIVGKLVAKGLVNKTASAGDKRRVDLTVSKAGRALLAKLAPVQRQVNDVEFEPLTRKEMAILLDLMERLIESGNRAVALQRFLAKDQGRTT